MTLSNVQLHTKTWCSYIVSHIVDQCLQYSADSCPGCADGMHSPLLHIHNSTNLRQKIERYFYRVISKINIESTFDDFVILFGYFALDRSKYINIGEVFLQVSNPDSIYFGNYINASLDAAIHTKHTPSTSETEACSMDGDTQPIVSTDPGTTAKNPKKGKHRITVANGLNHTKKAKIHSPESVIKLDLSSPTSIS